jgi:hypothetical protein
MKTYNIFISHSWAYGDAYEKLVNFFNEASYFSYKNFSIPKNDPVHVSTDKELKQAIENKISLCHSIVILAGVYATYSKWINKEIEIAVAKGKPIIAIQPWAAEKTSQVVKNNADVIVGWNSKPIVQAIKDYSL